MDLKPIIIQTVAWGEQYLSDLLFASIPSLMSAGNLPAVQSTVPLRFQFITDREGEGIIRESEAYAYLSSVASVEFISIEQMARASVNRTNKYDVVTHYQRTALGRLEEESFVVFSYPDFIWGDGSLKFLFDALVRDSRAFFAFIPYCSAERFTLEVLQNDSLFRGSNNGPVLTMSNRALAHFVVSRPNRGLSGFMWDDNTYNSYPAYLSWRVESASLYVRCFHMHPLALFIRPPEIRRMAVQKGTLDTELVSAIMGETDDCFVATDSDEFAVCSLRYEHERPVPEAGRRPTVASVADWARREAAAVHWHLFSHSVEWKGEPRNPHSWQDVRWRADAIAERISDLRQSDRAGRHFLPE